MVNNVILFVWVEDVYRSYSPFIFCRFCLLVNQCECLKNQKLEQVQRPWVSYMFAVITTTTLYMYMVYMKFIRHMAAFGKLPIPANMRHMSAIVLCHIKSHHITLLHFTEHFAKLITSPLLCFTAHITKLNTSQLLCVLTKNWRTSWRRCPSVALSTCIIWSTLPMHAELKTQPLRRSCYSLSRARGFTGTLG